MADERGFLYHPAEAPGGRLFNTQAERDALSPGWVDTPTKFPAPLEIETPVFDLPDAVLESSPVKRGPGRPRKDAA